MSRTPAAHLGPAKLDSVSIGVVDVPAGTPWRVKIGGGCPLTPVMLGAAEPA